MAKNVGTTDQVIRFVVGLGLMSLYIYGDSAAMRWTGLGVGTVLVLTSIFSFCPVYALFRVNTRGIKNRPPQKRAESEKVAQFRAKGQEAGEPLSKEEKTKQKKEDRKDAA